MASVSLKISRTETGQYLVVVNGEGFFNAVNKAVGARVRGEDTFIDDFLFGIGSVPIIRVQQNGSFVLSRTVAGSALNEDWGRDEIYALVDVPGYGSQRTNTVTGNF